VAPQEPPDFHAFILLQTERYSVAKFLAAERHPVYSTGIVWLCKEAPQEPPDFPYLHFSTNRTLLRSEEGSLPQSGILFIAWYDLT
jgi:hypothetical protein